MGDSISHKLSAKQFASLIKVLLALADEPFAEGVAAMRRMMGIKLLGVSMGEG
jgi:hypothetical protein